MRKIIATLAIALTLGLGAYADTHSTFQSEFGSLADSLATSLAVDATLGSNWSDAYIGSFPHFGAGVTVGGLFTGANSTTALSSLGVSLPSALANYGLPVPALGGSFKIGLPFLPIDVGVKGMYVPASISDTLLSGSGVGAILASLGVQVRYALVKQTILLPNVSIGAAYNYQQGNVSASIGSSQTYYVDSTHYITASSPDLKIDWTGNSFDFTAQVSKQLLFIIPYLGIGATFGSSTVSSSIDSAMTTSQRPPPKVEAWNM